MLPYFSTVSPGLRTILSTSPLMSKIGVKSIKDHNLLISLFHGWNRWLRSPAVLAYPRNCEPGIADFPLFLILGSEILSRGSNLLCDEKRNPAAAPLAVKLSGAAHRTHENNS